MLAASRVEKTELFPSHRLSVRASFSLQAFRLRIGFMAEVINQREQGKAMDGLWTAEFGTSTGMFGGGVAVFRDGQVLGGDATYFYVGEYQFKGKNFEATLRSSPFIKGAQSIFKTAGQDLTLEIIGSLTDQDHAIGQGYPKGMENLKFAVKLTRRT